MTDLASPEAAETACICKGNWRLLVKETADLLDKQFRSYDDKTFTFFGLVHGSDDYYYGMWSKEHGLRLLSCVGSIDGHGYEQIATEAP